MKGTRLELKQKSLWKLEKDEKFQSFAFLTLTRIFIFQTVPILTLIFLPFLSFFPSKPDYRTANDNVEW